MEAIRSFKKTSQRFIAKIYKVLYATLTTRIAGQSYYPETKANCYKLKDIKEDIIIQYILDLNSRGFAP